MAIDTTGLARLVVLLLNRQINVFLFGTHQISVNIRTLYVMTMVKYLWQKYHIDNILIYLGSL